jgi:hypothetical protein
MSYGLWVILFPADFTSRFIEMIPKQYALAYFFGVNSLGSQPQGGDGTGQNADLRRLGLACPFIS